MSDERTRYESTTPDPDSAFAWDAWAPTFPYDPDADEGLRPLHPDRALGLKVTPATED